MCEDYLRSCGNDDAYLKNCTREIASLDFVLQLAVKCVKENNIDIVCSGGLYKVVYDLRCEK